MQQVLPVIVLSVLVTVPLGAPAQAPAPARPPEHEVASVRQNLNPDRSWRMDFTADGFSALNVTLDFALKEAFGVYDERLWSGGPAWIKEKRFDIEAKVDILQYPNATLEQRRSMLQQLMVERFKLAVHHERKDFPLYALVVAKRGRLFKETKTEDLQRSPEWGVMCVHSHAGKGVLEMSGCSMEQLASSLDLANGDLGRKVVDHTGLTGRYDFRLTWTPIMASGPTGVDANRLDGLGPSIFAATKEQLGLELKPWTGPLDTIVIDHVEMPTQN